MRDPVTKSSIAESESVQMLPPLPRFCCSNCRNPSSATSVLQEFGWEDLQSRPDQNKAAMIYRIVNNLVEIPAGQYLIATGTATREHHQHFLPIYCSISQQGTLLSINSPPPERSTCQSNISASFGRLQPPCGCRYPKTVIVTNMFLTGFNCT